MVKAGNFVIMPDMSKKYKGKTCVYCAMPASSQGADHVFAREFFMPNKRGNLPKVPACNKCNSEKSKLEDYLTAILPFGGVHSDSLENLEVMVPPRLASKPKLNRSLSTGQKIVWEKENSVFVPKMTLPVDGNKISELFCFIVKGLMWYHWKVIIPQNYYIGAGTLTKEGEAILLNLFNSNAKQRVKVDLGNGTIHYEGMQGMDYPELGLWRFTMYGGIKFGRDDTSEFHPSVILASASRIPLKYFI